MGRSVIGEQLSMSAFRFAPASIAAALALLTPPVLIADTVFTFNTTANTEDAFVYSSGTTVNTGSSSSLEVGALSGNRNTRTLIRFDPSTIPVGQAVTSATLTLTATRIDNYLTLGTQDTANKNFVLSAYRVLADDWVEGTGNFQVRTGAVTWSSKQHATVPWSTIAATPDGTDVALSPTATVNYTANAWRINNANLAFSWDVTADVQAWSLDRDNQPLPAWVIISNLESTGSFNNGVVFASSENVNTALVPVLTIAVPEPASVALLGGGLCLLLCRSLWPTARRALPSSRRERQS